MPEKDYRQALDTASREWERLASQRADLDSRLADLQRTIASLMRLCGFEPTVGFGMTDACRLILCRHRGEALSARRVKEELEILGRDLSDHANPLASIHVTLKRLVAAGEVRFIPKSKGTPPMYALEESSTHAARNRPSPAWPASSRWPAAGAFQGPEPKRGPPKRKTE